MTNKLKYMKELFEKNVIYREYSDKRKRSVRLNFILNRIFHRTALIDYVQYNYFLLSRYGRERFVSVSDKQQLTRILNDPEVMPSFHDKRQFNHTFKKFITRLWFDPQKGDLEAFESFLQQTPRFLSKPVDSTYGIGIRLWDSEAIEDKEAFLNLMKKEDSILEEIVVAHPTMADFNPDSLNTLRVVSYLDTEGHVSILGSAVRFGRAGSFVDNNHSGGVSSIVDVETGVVICPGTDRDFNRYVFHPDSKKQIVGFCIPHWLAVVDQIKEMALIDPRMRYIGWDVAVTPKGHVEVIEANVSPDPDVLQIADKVGKRPFMESVVKELR